MPFGFSRFVLWASILMVAPIALCAQSTADASSPSPDGPDRRFEAKTIQDMLAKQRALRNRKEHEEMLKRGEEALALAEELEHSLGDGRSVSTQDLKRLEDLEKLITKIRNELGGDDDDEPRPAQATGDIVEAFKFVRESTLKLVDELKKTTRFSISAAAIQTSNSLIRAVRFLRLRR